MWPRKENMALWCFSVAITTGILSSIDNWGPLIKEQILWPTTVLTTAFGATILMTGPWIPQYRARQRACRLIRHLGQSEQRVETEKPVRLAELLKRSQLTALYRLTTADDLPKKVGTLENLDWHLHDLWIIASEVYRPWAEILRDVLIQRNPDLRVGYRSLRQGEPVDVFSRIHCFSASRKCCAFVSADLVGDPLGKMQINDALMRQRKQRPDQDATFLHAVAVDEGGYRYMMDSKELASFAKLPPQGPTPGRHLGLIRNLVKTLETDMELPRPDITEHSVFVSYSHQDAHWLDEMTSALTGAALKTVLWDDRIIASGIDFEREICVKLLTAKAVCLLVSEPFLASTFIRSRELKGAVQLAKDGYLKLFWLIVSNCNLNGVELERFQAVHDTSQPLDSMNEDGRHEVWHKLSSAIQDEIF